MCHFNDFQNPLSKVISFQASVHSEIAPALLDVSRVTFTDSNTDSNTSLAFQIDQSHGHVLGESRVVGFSVSLRLIMELLGWMTSFRVPLVFK